MLELGGSTSRLLAQQKQQQQQQQQPLPTAGQACSWRGPAVVPAQLQQCHVQHLQQCRRQQPQRCSAAQETVHLLPRQAPQGVAASAQLPPGRHSRQHVSWLPHKPASRGPRRACAAAAAGGDGSTPAAAQQGGAGASASSNGGDGGSHSQQRGRQQPRPVLPRIMASSDEDTYSLRDTQVLVETAMLSAVSGLAFLLSTLLKLDSSLGYFLPLPITIAACRSGAAAGWHAMMATAFLLLVLLGPLRATTYVLMHGVLAASLGSMWLWHWPWQASILAGAVLRMSGQLAYLVLSSLTMNENLFSIMLANVHNLLDQLYAALGSYGSTSTLTIACMIFALLLVNGICYVFLLHVIYHVILSSMGFKLGPLPGFVRKFLYVGAPAQAQAPPAAGGGGHA